MKTLQIRNVPDDIHRQLRTRAAAAGQSLSDYALDELRNSVARPPVAEVLRRAASRAGGIESETIVASVRQGRDERS